MNIGPQTKRAIDKLQKEILEGLKHGFFDYGISCEIIQGKKRRLQFKAGKSHCFLIPEEEILFS